MDLFDIFILILLTIGVVLHFILGNNMRDILYRTHTKKLQIYNTFMEKFILSSYEEVKIPTWLLWVARVLIIISVIVEPNVIVVGLLLLALWSLERSQYYARHLLDLFKEFEKQGVDPPIS